MKAILTLCLIILVKGLSAQTTYSTIADGNWGSASTWRNGMIPSTNINYSNKIIITHNVVYNRPNDLEITKGSLKIIEGELNFPRTGIGSGRSLNIRKHGKLVVTSGILSLPITNSTGGNNSGNLNNEEGVIAFTNSIVEVAQNFKSTDASNTYIQSCIKVGENYENDDTKEIYDRTCIELGLQGSGNFTNKGDIKVNLASILLKGTSGHIKNTSSSSKIRKYQSATIGFSALGSPDDLENNGIWDAPIANYCVADNIQGSRAWDIDFTSPENCPAVNATVCNCTAALASLQVSTWAGMVYSGGVCALPEICAMPINYFFDSTINGVNIPWPDVNGNGSSNGNVEVAWYNYTEAEGRAIYNSPDPNGVITHAKKGFIAIATLRLSSTNYAQDPALLAASNTINMWLYYKGKLSPSNLNYNNLAVSQAADVINEWIVVNRCPDRR